MTPTRALELHVKGRCYWNMRTQESLNLSVQFFQEAIAHDPDYLPAYAGLADAWNVSVGYGFAPRAATLKDAEAYALKVRGLDESLAEGHASLAFIHNERLEWKDAAAEYERALELNPDYVTAHHWYANYFGEHGDFKSALAHVDRAFDLDPLSISVSGARGAILLVARRYDAAIEQLEKTLKMAPTIGRIRMVLAEAYAHGGGFSRALTEINQAAELPGGWSAELLADKGYVLALSGGTAEALGIAAQLENAGEFGSAAVVYAGLGNGDSALGLLVRARAMPERVISDLKTDPRFDKIRAEPGFVRLLSDIGFAP